MAGAIPIYSAYSDDPEPGIINPKAILYWYKDNDNSVLLHRIAEINKSESERNRFLEQPKFLPGAEVLIHEMVQKVLNPITQLLNAKKTFN